MCLAVPTKVLSIHGQEAEVEMDGVLRPVSILLTPEVRVGDYVLIHTGYAISVIDREEAKKTLDLFASLPTCSAEEGRDDLL